MYNNILQSIDNIAVWPVISFVIFFLFFLCLLWYVFTADKGFIKAMKELPLEDGSINSLKEHGKTSLNKTATIICVFLFSSLGAAAQDASAEKSYLTDAFNSPLLPVYTVGALVLITLILTVTVAIVLLKSLNIFIQQAGQEKAARLGIPYKPSPSWWTKIWDQANDLVPLEEEKNIELAHSYDGIKELDNHLPPWWKGLFYGCIVFAVIYMVMYHLTDSLPLSDEEYQIELATAAEDARLLRASRPPELVDENTLVYSAEAEIIARGRVVFTSSNCGSCHRADAGGSSIGPNLTDAYWLHGGSIKDVFHTIKVGVVEKAMPAWGKVMSEKDVRDVAFFVMSLQGSNPPNPKPSQGELFVAPKVKSDSVRSDTLKMAIKQ